MARVCSCAARPVFFPPFAIYSSICYLVTLSSPVCQAERSEGCGTLATLGTLGTLGTRGDAGGRGGTRWDAGGHWGRGGTRTGGGLRNSDNSTYELFAIKGVRISTDVGTDPLPDRSYLGTLSKPQKWRLMQLPLLTKIHVSNETRFVFL
jgi:hypothetical protein